MQPDLPDRMSMVAFFHVELVGDRRHDVLLLAGVGFKACGSVLSHWKFTQQPSVEPGYY